jgi:hypothetical protein
MAAECDKQPSFCARLPAAPRAVVRAEADGLCALQFDRETPSRTPIHERLHLSEIDRTGGSSPKRQRVCCSSSSRVASRSRALAVAAATASDVRLGVSRQRVDAVVLVAVAAVGAEEQCLSLLAQPGSDDLVVVAAAAFQRRVGCATSVFVSQFSTASRILSGAGCA